MRASVSAMRGPADSHLAQLFYKSGRLRVAINTGNSVPYDWRDIENVPRPRPPAAHAR
jgi:hypothetical protein